MSAHRQSFLKTTMLASVACGGLIVVGALLVVFLADRIPLVLLVVAGALLVLAALAAGLVAFGGRVVLARDARQQAGRPDLFIELNRSRWEEGVLNGDARSLWRRLLNFGGGWNPQVGEEVEIRSLEEILPTLDEQGCLDGMPFQSEMAQFCGRRARVFRNVDKIYDYGGTKAIKRVRDAVELVNLRCDGAGHGGCQAKCYIIWKTVWLRRPSAGSVASTQTRTVPAEARARLAPPTRAATADGEILYRCQYTQLASASTFMKRWDLRQDVRPLLSGNVTLAAFSVAILTRIFNRAQRARHGVTFPFIPPSSGKQTPLVVHDLQAGDAARILPAAEISRTLNDRGRNRGLWFDADMLKHVNQRHIVQERVDRLIDDATGRMLPMKVPCIVLERVYASGEYLRFSPQHDFLYWREAWLAPDERQAREPLKFERKFAGDTSRTPSATVKS